MIVAAAVRFQSVSVGTAAEYNTALDAQLRSRTPIILHITAPISGNRSTGGAAFNHAGNSVWLVSRMSDDLIHIITLAEGGVVVLFDPDSPLPASADTIGVLVYDPVGIELQRTVETPFVIRDFETGDLAGGRVFGGSTNRLDHNDDSYYFYTGPANSGIPQFAWVHERSDGTNVQITNLGNIFGPGLTWRSYQATLEAVQADATEADWVYAFGSRVIVVQQPLSYAWEDFLFSVKNSIETLETGLREITTPNEISSPTAEQDSGRDDGEVALLTMDKNVTVTIQGGVDGQSLLLRCTQDATGGRTLTLGVNVGINTAARERPTLSIGAETVDLLMFHRKGTVWTYTGIIKDV